MSDVKPMTAQAGPAPPSLGRACDVDLMPVVERVMRKMGDSVTQVEVLTLLQALLEREFSDARVLVYVPVLLQRRACDCLRSACAAARADLPPAP